jgi:WD40 repeat protein
VTTLKASHSGCILIRQARQLKGWAVNDFRWLEAASEVLAVSWVKQGKLAPGISEGTWKRFLAGKMPINAEAFKAYCQVLQIDWMAVVADVPDQPLDQPLEAPAPLDRQIDWGDAPDVSIFYGREQEQQRVKSWIVQENCRLVTLLGMGGIGKTALSVKLAKAIAQTNSLFQVVIWRSLRNAPTIEDLLTDLMQVLSQETELPTALDRKITHLLNYLRHQRCLLVLDNAESILRAGDRSGRYRPGYEGYGQLLRCVAETAHQSCVILTSREKPQGMAKFEGETLQVRSLQLTGLSDDHGRELFTVKGTFSASETEWQTLFSRYGGNPLALKIVASSIHDYFDGNISSFLDTTAPGAFLFEDIRDLLNQQFQRLTPLECDILYWLAIAREPITLPKLQADFVAKLPPHELLESLNSLQRRSLIERMGSRFSQQPVVMEYVTAQLIEQVSHEIVNQSISLFSSHALTQAQAKEYVRETQCQLILQPILDQVAMSLGTLDNMTDCLRQILANLRGRRSIHTGYAAGNALNLLHQAGANLTGFDVSQLTVWQAYLQGVSLHHVDFSGADLFGSVFTETLGNILSVAFSSDGHLLATCDTDCTVRLWEVKTGRLVLICHGHTNWVRAVTFSPSGQTLASCGADGLVKLWNVADGICLKTFAGHEHEVFAVAFSPDGNWLASASGDRTVKLWHMQSGACAKTLIGHTDWVRSLTFSDSLLASSGADQTIKLWEVESATCLATLRGHQGWVRSIAFNPAGTILASGSSDRTIKLWQVATQECIATYTGHQGNIYAIAFGAQRDILVSGSGDRTVKIWDCQTHTCIKTLHGQSNEVCAVAVSADAETIACVSLDQTMRLWDYQSGHCLKTWYGNTDWALPVAFSPSGDILASGSNDKTVKLWDWQTGDCLRSLQGHSDFIYGLAFNADSTVLASASTDSMIRLWTLKTGLCRQILQGHTDWVYAVAFHPSDSTLISGSADCTLKIWDWYKGQCLSTLTGHTDKIQSLALSQDGQMLATASADQTIRLWDYATRDCLKVLDGHENRVYAVAFHGELLASCSTDHTIKVWHWQTGQCLKTLTGHTNWVFAIAFSPNGQTLVSASHDQTVRIWDVETGQCRHIGQEHQHLVSAIAYHPTQEVIASGSQDQTVRIWQAATGKCDRVLIAKRLYEGMKLIGVKGLTPATIATLQTLGAII